MPILQINSLLKMIPPPHFLENYFAEVKIKKLIWNEWFIFIFIDIYNN
jgi:hypothetical protein